MATGHGIGLNAQPPVNRVSASRLSRGVWAATALLLLCHCATGYHPPGVFGDGFSEQRVATDRWIVRFDGSAFTPRQRVETYLLFRCAEVTIENNARYFVILGGFSDLLVSPDFHPGPTTPTLIDSPEWLSEEPLAAKTDSSPTRRHAARVIIQTFRERRPRGNARVYEAQELIKQLAPRMRAV